MDDATSRPKDAFDHSKDMFLVEAQTILRKILESRSPGTASGSTGRGKFNKHQASVRCESLLFIGKITRGLPILQFLFLQELISEKSKRIMISVSKLNASTINGKERKAIQWLS